MPTLPTMDHNIDCEWCRLRLAKVRVEALVNLKRLSLHLCDQCLAMLRSSQEYAGVKTLLA